ncbi:HlyC/CorC family transporter [Bacillus sp. AGMB 02131]|uniref:HlyC/CorC family transporter n=2 Tax=Peribacillus faecalis TaxID=2772559 RepID=A0A927CYN4_9BACI|nr:HlyC/CorC family transporter [Peribacillus faecalis]
MDKVDSSWLIDLLIVFLLIIGNGIFAMTEIALISCSEAKLKNEAEKGKTSAKLALRYLKDPTDLMSTVQVGITLIGIINGAFGGARLSTPFANLMINWGLSSDWAYSISYIVVVTAITYLSLIVGELVPKRMAFAAPERITLTVIPTMNIFSKIMRPFIWILSKSTLYVFSLLGLKKQNTSQEAESEIKQLLSKGVQDGAFAHDEVQQVERVFAFHDQLAFELMQPRTTLDWIDLEDTNDDIAASILNSKHNKLPVGQGSLDDFLGFVDVRDVLMDFPITDAHQITKHLKQPLILPRQMDASAVLQSMQKSGSGMAFVLDEYGGFLGMITLFDILEAIVGDIPIEEEEPELIVRHDGSYLADGLLHIEDLKRYLDIKDPLPGEERSSYHTVAGLFIYLLGDLPKKGSRVSSNGYTFEVVDLDGNRIDQLLIEKLPEEEESSAKKSIQEDGDE